MAYEYEKMMNVKKNNGCGNLGCFAVAATSKKTYTLLTCVVKGNESNDYSMLSYYSSYTASKPTSSIKLKVGHGNAMTMDTNYIYCPFAGTNKVLRISRKKLENNTAKPVTMTFPEGIEPGAMTYYSGKTFIIRVKGKKTVDGKVYEMFRFAIVDNKAKTFTVATGKANAFLVPKYKGLEGFNSQDCNYKQGYGLFLPTPYSKNGKLVYNKIAQINIDGKPSSTVNGYKVYKPVTTIQIDNSSYAKFECEEVAFSLNNYLLFGGNMDYKGENDSDAIYRIKKTKFKL